MGTCSDVLLHTKILAATCQVETVAHSMINRQKRMFRLEKVVVETGKACNTINSRGKQRKEDNSLSKKRNETKLQDVPK